MSATVIASFPASNAKESSTSVRRVETIVRELNAIKYRLERLDLRDMKGPAQKVVIMTVCDLEMLRDLIYPLAK